MLYKARVYIPRGGEGTGFYWSYKGDESGSGEGSGRGSKHGSGLGQGYARKAQIPTPTQVG